MLDVASCDLIINDTINQSNSSITEEITQSFTQTLSEGNYNWSVNCFDSLGNENNSLTRLVKIDTTFPTISNSNANSTNVSILDFICLNTTIDDSLSGIDTVWAYVFPPSKIPINVMLHNDVITSCDQNSTDNVYSVNYQLNQVGQYNWTDTYVQDTAGNINNSFAGFIWNSTSVGTMTINMTYPTVSFEINESEQNFNYTYNQTCKVVCDDSPQNCDDVYLYAQTIAFNIALSDECDMARVREVCSYVNASGFIEKLEKGYETKLRERGENLSTGQRKLLAFARALYHNPRFLFLDEATSAVDTETEALIQDALVKITRDVTSIVVAHRLSTIQSADCILVMHCGEIVEIGTHEELLSSAGIYHKLWEMQSFDMKAK